MFNKKIEDYYYQVFKKGQVLIVEEPINICVYNDNIFFESIKSFFSEKNNRDIIKLYEKLDKVGCIKLLDVNKIILKIAEIKLVIISKESEIDVYTFDKVLYDGNLLWIDDFFFEDKYSRL